MERLCGVCQQKTMNKDWCDKCLEHSKVMKCEIEKRKKLKTAEAGKLT